MSKEFRIGSLTDSEVFETDLTKMSTQFVAAFLSRQDKPMMTLTEQNIQELCQKAVEISHHLLIEIQEVVEEYKKTNE